MKVKEWFKETKDYLKNSVTRAMKIKILLGCVAGLGIISALIIMSEMPKPKKTPVEIFDYFNRAFASIEYDSFKASNSDRIQTYLIELGIYKNEEGEVKKIWSDEEIRPLCEKYTPDRFFAIMMCIQHIMFLEEDYMPQSFIDNYIKTLGVDIYSAGNIYKLANSGDWYEKHPTADPQPSSKPVHGGRNVGPDNEVVYESKENKTTVSYYGDYAVSYLNGYSFDEGMYEWINGKFYDVPSSWSKFRETGMWYRGKKIATDNEYNSNKFFLYEDTFYVIDYVIEKGKRDSGKSVRLWIVEAN